VIAPGDLASCEISAAAVPDYAGQVLRTFTVGAPPTALYSELHAVAAAYDARSSAGASMPCARPSAGQAMRRAGPPDGSSWLN
jgi:hypothetical protein